MFNIKTMNKIAAVGLDRLPAENYTVGDSVENEDGILVRSPSSTTITSPPAYGPSPGRARG